MNNDQNILDVVVNVTRDLRHNGEMTRLLRKLSDEEAREVARKYIDWIYENLLNTSDLDQTPD
jgi:hypothetical protein